MKIITRTVAINNLSKYIGKELSSFAEQYGITITKNGKYNKGWKGQVLERLAGLDNNNSKAPNGLSYELKSVAFYYKKEELVPKETMAIAMINPEELLKTEFFSSHCWTKLKSIVFCAVMWNGKNSTKAKFLNIANFDFAQDDELIQEIKHDYDYIRNKLIKHGWSSLTGKDGKWIQARTKGVGHGSNTRAFYARKQLVNKIFELGKINNK